MDRWRGGWLTALRLHGFARLFGGSPMSGTPPECGCDLASRPKGCVYNKNICHVHGMRGALAWTMDKQGHFPGKSTNLMGEKMLRFFICYRYRFIGVMEQLNSCHEETQPSPPIMVQWKMTLERLPLAWTKSSQPAVTVLNAWITMFQTSDANCDLPQMGWKMPLNFSQDQEM